MTTAEERRDTHAGVAPPFSYALALALAVGSIAAGPPAQDPHARDASVAVAPAETATTAHAEPTPAELKAREAEERRLEALQREYERLADEAPTLADKTTTPAGGSGEPSIFGAFLKMVVVLGGVCVLAYLLLGKLLPRLMKIESPVARNHIMTVIDRLPLDQRRAILILRIGDGYFLVGAADNGITLLSRLDAAEVSDALAAQAAQKPEPGRVASVFLRRS